MLRRYSALLLTLVVALALPSSALAQSYSYSLDKEVVHAFWNQDGTLGLDYTFTFTNQPGAHVIDFVDVALPSYSFNLNDISADVGGRPMQISSDFQGSGSGVAVALGADAIPPGQSGTVHVFVQEVQNVLYPDSGDDQYVSAVFAPAQFTNSVGSTDLTVIFHLPPGVKPDEPRWHTSPAGFPPEPQASLDSDGRVMYIWSAPAAYASTEYDFGASFPKSYVPAGTIASSYVPVAVTSQAQVPVDIAAQPFPSDIGDAVSGMGPMLFICSIILLLFGPLYVGVIQGQRRKLQYLPPRVSIEGHGIKRGLTAVEAAIVMQEPLDKVMTMILFGVIKKNAARVLERDPLRLEAASPLPGSLRHYEATFLKAFQEDSLQERQALLQGMFVNLVKTTSERMKGFSRNETVAYYKSIIEEAWQQVEAAKTPEVRSQLFDENLDWTMLDRDFDGRTRRVFTDPVFVPMWWGYYDPTFSRPSASAETPAATSGAAPSQLSSIPGQLPSVPGQPSVPIPHLPGSDFAASLASGIQTFSQRVIGDISTFTNSVTHVTNPPPPPTPRSTSGWGGTGGFSGRSGGGGCACACACACAGCACACAGGSR